ncbi:peptidoglycan-binding protein [Streptomyces sp. NPDC087212]|uniref:peptidoglycan-binding domain-containing protein n=1 Tax=Streptomyces sp. NPDC087212 TaxID=3365766 RepID=UPI00382ACE00
MPTPPGSRPRPPDERTPLEPIRVLRPRRTDALAELIREMQESRDDATASAHRDYESVTLPPERSRNIDDDTEELPSFPREQPYTRRDVGAPGPDTVRSGLGRGQRLAAGVIAVGAAAVIGFGCALLLPGRTDAATTRPEPSASATRAPAPAPSGAADPDGAGTLREGAVGPEVSDLQERLLKIPNVYENGSTSGTYDATLTEAVARFQLWYGIRGDENGVYGDDTRTALESRTG